MINFTNSKLIASLTHSVITTAVAGLFVLAGLTSSVSAAKVAPPYAPVMNATTVNTNDGSCQASACFYYVGGDQNNFTGTGASVSFTQADPKVGPNDFHSLTELAVESADGTQIVEVGWIVAQQVNNDNLPHLFVFHWVNGQSTCYNGCGFVPYANAKIAAGAKIKSSGVGSFEINFSANKWIVYYNGSRVGYFPESIWGGSFTSIGLAQVFGEVAGSVSNPPQTQMGNGVLGSKANSNVMENFSLIGTSVKPKLNTYIIADQTVYDSGKVKATSLNYGGPGN